MLSISHADIHNDMEEQTRPKEDSPDEEAEEDTTPSTPPTLAQSQAAYDNTGRGLFAILPSVKGETSILPGVIAQGRNDRNGHGHKAWQELHSKCMIATDETIRCKSSELIARTRFRLILPSSLPSAQSVPNMGEPIMDQRFRDIMIQGLSEEYKHIN